MVLPFLAMTGGTKVFVEHANRLFSKGHDVTLVYPWYHTPPRTLYEYIKGPTKGIVNPTFRALGLTEIRWMPVNVPLRAVRRLRERHLPNADLLVATENQTIDPLEHVSSIKGKKVYLIQGYETWTRDPERVDATWRSRKWHKITVASWLQKLAIGKFASNADLVVNGVDLKVFHPRGRTHHNRPRVLCLYHHLEEKGIRDAIAAMRAVQARGIDFQPVFFGTIPPGPDLASLGGLEYHRFPVGERLRKLYASADIFVSPSWSEGCQLPPMEAMACGAAVIATNIGGVPDYTIAGETAVVVGPKQPMALANALAELLMNPAKRTMIAAAGEAYIQQFSWERTANNFERVLKRVAGKIDAGIAA